MSLRDLLHRFRTPSQSTPALEAVDTGASQAPTEDAPRSSARVFVATLHLANPITIDTFDGTLMPRTRVRVTMSGLHAQTLLGGDPGFVQAFLWDMPSCYEAERVLDLNTAQVTAVQGGRWETVDCRPKGSHGRLVEVKLFFPTRVQPIWCTMPALFEG